MMKTTMKKSVLLMVFVIAGLLCSRQISAQQNSINFQVFYDQLSPYGQWMDYPNLGYVWIPDEGDNFVPYSTQGYWIMTEYGWTWLSDYSWGWAPFHYGRWDYDNYYGWFWVPDYEWGPAWVNWRSANGYYGWSPMQPGISISLSFGSDYNSRNDHWMFVRDRNIGRSNIDRYYVSRTEHDHIVRNSRVINNTYTDNRNHSTYVAGPAREEVQRITGRTVRSVDVQESIKPGQNVSNGHLRIYKPPVTRDYNSDRKYTPSRVIIRKEADRPTERIENNQHRNNNSNVTVPEERQLNNVKSRQNNTEIYKNSNSRKNNPEINNTNDNRRSNPEINNTRNDRKSNPEINNTNNNRKSNPEINNTNNNRKSNPEINNTSNNRKSNNTEVSPGPEKEVNQSRKNTDESQKATTKSQERNSTRQTERSRPAKERKKNK